MTIPGIGMYSASKAALNMLTKTMAIELGAHNIRVNAVGPAAVVAPLAVSYKKACNSLVAYKYQRYAYSHEIAKCNQTIVFIESAS